jgi:hypothetical protein
MAVVRRALKAGAPEGVANLIATRLAKRPITPVLITTDQQIDALIYPEGRKA